MPLIPSVVPGLVMLLIGLIGVDRAVLSWDEVATADVARRSAGQIWHLLHTVDAVFAPYYLLMRGWTAVAGNTVVDLRLPSIIAMAGAVAAAGELGRRLFNAAVGLVAGVVLCMMPNTSRYAEEARPYAIACLFAGVAILLLYRALDRPGVGRWLLYGLAVAGLGLSHIVALTLLGAHLAITVRHSRATGSRRPVLLWSAAVAGASVLLAPLAWLGVHQRHEQLYWVPPLTARSLYAFPGGVVGSVPAAWLLAGLVVIALWRPSRPMIDMVIAAAVPAAAVALVSVLGPSFWVARYLLIVLPPTAIVAAAGLYRLSTEPGRPARWGVDRAAARVLAVCALFAVAAVPGQLSVRGRTAKNGSDYRSAAAIIAARQQPGDDIVYTARSRTLRAGVDYYLRHDPGRPLDVLLRRSAASVGSLRASEYSDAVRRLTGASRVWLLVAGRHSDPTTVRPDLRPLLLQRYRRVQIWQVNRATLALFARPAPGSPAGPAH
jgi:mannosyltransferase